MKIYIAGKITGEQKAEVEEKFRSASCKLKSEMASALGGSKKCFSIKTKTNIKNYILNKQ